MSANGVNTTGRTNVRFGSVRAVRISPKRTLGGGADLAGRNGRSGSIAARRPAAMVTPASAPAPAGRTAQRVNRRSISILRRKRCYSRRLWW